MNFFERGHPRFPEAIHPKLFWNTIPFLIEYVKYGTKFLCFELSAPTQMTQPPHLQTVGFLVGL